MLLLETDPWRIRFGDRRYTGWLVLAQLFKTLISMVCFRGLSESAKNLENCSSSNNLASRSGNRNGPLRPVVGHSIAADSILSGGIRVGRTKLRVNDAELLR